MDSRGVPDVDDGSEADDHGDGGVGTNPPRLPSIGRVDQHAARARRRRCRSGDRCVLVGRHIDVRLGGALPHVGIYFTRLGEGGDAGRSGGSVVLACGWLVGWLLERGGCGVTDQPAGGGERWDGWMDVEEGAMESERAIDRARGSVDGGAVGREELLVGGVEELSGVGW